MEYIMKGVLQNEKIIDLDTCYLYDGINTSGGEK